MRGICEALRELGYVENGNVLMDEIWEMAKEGRR